MKTRTIKPRIPETYRERLRKGEVHTQKNLYDRKDTRRVLKEASDV